MANSTAWRFSTGNDPGRPRHTGQTLVLGWSPKALRQPQNNFVAVLSSQWTSSPMTISYVSIEVVSVIERILQCGGDAEHQGFLQRGGEHLHPDRQSIVTGAVGHAD